MHRASTGLDLEVCGGCVDTGSYLIGEELGRESEIIRLVAAGKSNKEIAAELFLSEAAKTVICRPVLKPAGTAAVLEFARYYRNSLTSRTIASISDRGSTPSSGRSSMLTTPL